MTQTLHRLLMSEIQRILVGKCRLRIQLCGRNHTSSLRLYLTSPFGFESVAISGFFCVAISCNFGFFAFGASSCAFSEVRFLESESWALGSAEEKVFVEASKAIEENFFTLEAGGDFLIMTGSTGSSGLEVVEASAEARLNCSNCMSNRRLSSRSRDFCSSKNRASIQ